MSIEYVEEISQLVQAGRKIFACPSQHSNKWFISENIEDLKLRAQKTADARRYDVAIYRLINPMEAVATDSYLIVTKLGDGGSHGDLNISWSLVDTREAAVMLRDVSEGPTPFFGAVVECSFKPHPEERKI